MPFQRKNIRLSGHNYLGYGTYFLTICCHDRHPHFADHAVGFWILDQLRREAQRCSFALHAYCVMPDHLHFLAQGSSPHSNLLPFISEFKRHTALSFRNRNAGPLWQKKFYEHVLRSTDALEHVSCYVWMSPVRKELCAEAAAYPLSGSDTTDWKKLVGTADDWSPPWKL